MFKTSTGLCSEFFFKEKYLGERVRLRIITMVLQFYVFKF
jgi:hypothetical protein